MSNPVTADAGPEGGGPVDDGAADAGVTDAGVGEPCAGPNPDPAPGVYWEQTSSQDAGLWVGPIAGPTGPGEPSDLVFIPEAELAKGFRGFVDTALSVTPIVGQVKDVVEAVTGHNFITGEDLSALERGLAVIGALGVLGKAVSVAGELSAGADLMRTVADKAVEAAKAADVVREGSTGFSRSEATLRFLDSLDEATAALRAADEFNAVGKALANVEAFDTAKHLAAWGKGLSRVGGIDSVVDWGNFIGALNVALIQDAQAADEAAEEAAEAEEPTENEPGEGRRQHLRRRVQHPARHTTGRPEPSTGAESIAESTPESTPEDTTQHTQGSDGTYDDGYSTQTGPPPAEPEPSAGAESTPESTTPENTQQSDGTYDDGYSTQTGPPHEDGGSETSEDGSDHGGGESSPAQGRGGYSAAEDEPEPAEGEYCPANDEPDPSGGGYAPASDEPPPEESSSSAVEEEPVQEQEEEVSSSPAEG